MSRHRLASRARQARRLLPTMCYKPLTLKPASSPPSPEENKEWMAGTLTGSMDFNHLPYLLSSAWGIITPAAHGASTTAKDWVGTPPVTGSVTPQTYTFEQGETATRAPM